LDARGIRFNYSSSNELARRREFHPAQGRWGDSRLRLGSKKRSVYLIWFGEREKEEVPTGALNAGRIEEKKVQK